jgi:antitoxin MazE
MHGVIRKWGNSAAVRLHASALEEADFSLEQEIRITVTLGRIVIEPADRVEYDLDELASGITTRNAHAGADFGRPVGKEAL